MNEAFPVLNSEHVPWTQIWENGQWKREKIISDPWLADVKPAVMPPSTEEQQQKEIVRLNGEIRNLYDHIDDLNQHCSMMLDRIEKLEKPDGWMRSQTSRQKK